MPTFGEECCLAIREWLHANNLKSLGAINAVILSELIDRCDLQRKERTKASRKKGTRPFKAADDSEWLDFLQKQPAYSSLEVRKEWSACYVYFNALPTPIPVSRKRFLNWLNNARTKVPMKVSDKPTNGTKLDPYAIPHFDWAERIARKWPREDFPDRQAWEEMSWHEIPVTIRREVLEVNP